MTQQPYYPPQQPGYAPPQQYAPQYPQAPQQPMQQPYPPQGYGQPPAGYGQAPASPPLAQGSLDDFYSQPSAGSGPGIGWHDGTPAKNPRPLGTTWIGTVVREVTSADVQQQTSPQGVPAFFRDGRPKFQMKVPLKDVMLFTDPSLAQRLALPADMTEGEATWYVRGQARDELTRAIAEAGGQGAPAAGATVMITLVNRRPNGGGMQPSNIVQIRYVGPQGAAAAVEQAQIQQPPVQAQQAPLPVPEAPQQPVQQGYAAEQYASYAGQPPAPQVQGPPIPQQFAQQPVQQNAAAQPMAQQVPQQPGAPTPPPALDERAQALLSQLTGGQPAA